MTPFIHFEKSRIDSLKGYNKFYATVDVLRLDIIHSVISGNKWFKLKEHVKEAREKNKKKLITFGGAYSNHIVATAAAGRQLGFKTVGIIRGERPPVLSHTLLDALSFGMTLEFISREEYKNKRIPAHILETDNDDSYLIEEGGYGLKGAEGAKSILQETDSTPYTHIVAAVGTGTMLAGLTAASLPHQNIIGISVLKNNRSLQNEIEALLPEEKKKKFTLIHEYHFGGYAKYNQQLIQFMNNWYVQNNIPSDFVYTGKLFFALNDLLEKKVFPAGSKVLAIHCGGLQGNLSLPQGTLIF